MFSRIFSYFIIQIQDYISSLKIDLLQSKLSPVMHSYNLVRILCSVAFLKSSVGFIVKFSNKGTAGVTQLV